jgi:hypothetical protein
MPLKSDFKNYYEYSQYRLEIQNAVLQLAVDKKIFNKGKKAPLLKTEYISRTLLQQFRLSTNAFRTFGEIVGTSVASVISIVLPKHLALDNKKQRFIYLTRKCFIDSLHAGSHLAVVTIRTYAVMMMLFSKNEQCMKAWIFSERINIYFLSKQNNNYEQYLQRPFKNSVGQFWIHSCDRFISSKNRFKLFGEHFGIDAAEVKDKGYLNMKEILLLYFKENPNSKYLPLKGIIERINTVDDAVSFFHANDAFLRLLFQYKKSDVPSDQNFVNTLNNSDFGKLLSYLYVTINVNYILAPIVY